MKRMKNGGFSPVWLVIAYLALCALRFGFACMTTLYPTTIPDEFLYYSMARSLGTGNGALLYGQKANFSYFLYPGMLSAVYALFGEGTNFYRLLQLESILVMNLSIFPIFALSRRLVSDEKKAFGLSVLALMMPDFILSARLLSESLLYPIFFLAMLFIWDGLRSGRISRFVAVGALGGLLYSIKPGQIVTPVVGLIAMAFSAFRTDRKKAALGVLGGVISLAAVCVSLYLVNKLAINPGTSVFSVYDSQIGFGEVTSIGAFLKALALSPYTFLLSCGVALLVIPLLRIREFGFEKRVYLAVCLVSVVILMAGTAWVVNRVEFKDPTVHLRYVAMFLPILLILMHSDADLQEGKARENDVYPTALLFALIGYSAVCVAAFGYDGSIHNGSSIFQYALSALCSVAKSHPGSIVAGILLVVLIAGLGLIAAKGGKRAVKICTGFFAVLIAANNLTAYTYMEEKAYQSLKDAAMEISSAAGDEEYLYVFCTNASRYDAYLDVNTKKNVSMVYVNDLFNRMLNGQGVYTPFVPGEIRGDIPDRETADTELILIDRDAFTQMKLAPSATVVKQTDYMTLVRIQKGERWLDSMSGGMIIGELSAGTDACFATFEEKGTHQKIRIDLELPVESKVRIRTENAGTFEFTLPAGRDQYSVDLPPVDGVIALCVMDSDAVIHGYEFM